MNILTIFRHAISWHASKKAERSIKWNWRFFRLLAENGQTNDSYWPRLAMEDCGLCMFSDLRDKSNDLRVVDQLF